MIKKLFLTNKNKVNGFILVGVLVYIAVFSILSMVLLSFLRNEIVAYQRTEADIRAEYLALGGVQAYQKLGSAVVLYTKEGDTSEKIVVTSVAEETVESTGIINEGREKETRFTIKIKNGLIISD
ncbi:MAG: hypothetical protein GYA02_14450 [Clostridiaceae bacterium]|nr:hypothetical protein [Clostridiaceae bacterium]